MQPQDLIGFQKASRPTAESPYAVPLGPTAVKSSLICWKGVFQFAFQRMNWASLGQDQAHCSNNVTVEPNLKDQALASGIRVMEQPTASEPPSVCIVVLKWFAWRYRLTRNLLDLQNIFCHALPF